MLLELASFIEQYKTDFGKEGKKITHNTTEEILYHQSIIKQYCI